MGPARIFWHNLKPKKAFMISTIYRTWPLTFCLPAAPTWCDLSTLQKLLMHSIHSETSHGLTIIFHGPSCLLMTMKNAQQICNAGSTFFRPFAVNTGPSSSMNIKIRTPLISACWHDCGVTVSCIAANLTGRLALGIRQSVLSGT